ncbi:MAG TPA: hypothetical protein VI756_25075 [Blastocatellia bacterium]
MSQGKPSSSVRRGRKLEIFLLAGNLCFLSLFWRSIGIGKVRIESSTVAMGWAIVLFFGFGVVALRKGIEALRETTTDHKTLSWILTVMLYGPVLLFLWSCGGWS